MASSSIHRQHSHSTLPLVKLQKLETVSLYYNFPEAAIICMKCGFALNPKRASEHPGKRLSMVDFRGLACEVLRSVTASCSRLMYDWEPTHIDLSLIQDNLSTTTPGYSFVSDPVNQLIDAYPELLLRACISPIDGLLRVQGKDHSTWDVNAAHFHLGW
ncbi:Uncharacterized protein HZ326_26137 [Fusarium oxysporum f. sp. albedinis]|nr:Uncharacterized protein HZ326_26137 [Fusarium oxysporum f. sp. albedinis]